MMCDGIGCTTLERVEDEAHAPEGWLFLEVGLQGSGVMSPKVFCSWDHMQGFLNHVRESGWGGD